MAAILSRPQCVNNSALQVTHTLQSIFHFGDISLFRNEPTDIS